MKQHTMRRFMSICMVYLMVSISIQVAIANDVSEEALENYSGSGNDSTAATPMSDMEDALPFEDMDSATPFDDGVVDLLGENDTATLASDGSIDINIDMPKYANSLRFSFEGTTAAGVVVDVYVNDNLANTVMSDDSGQFRFSRVVLTPNQENTIRVTASDLDSDASGEETYTVIADDTPPEFTSITELPEVLTSHGYTVQGETSEPVRVEVGVGEPLTDITYTEIASNVTEFTYELALDEGEQFVDIRITDRAGNTARHRKTIFVDTVPPEILEHNLADLTPTYSREITVRGEISEQADVIIVVDGKCTGGDINRVEPFDMESGGSFGCLNFDGSDSLTRNVYRTTTDNDGKFSQRVRIRPTVGAAFASIDVPTAIAGEETRTEIEGRTGGFDVDIQIFAVDSVGNVGSDEGTVTYATCTSTDSDFLVFQGPVFPGAIIPDLVFQGIATISFELELEYFGQGTPEVNGLFFRERVLSVEDQSEFDVNVFNPNNCQGFPDSTGLKWHVTCRLNRFPADAHRNISAAYEYFREQPFLKMPIDFDVQYSVNTLTPTGETEQVSRNQAVCYDLQFLIDQRVDPSKIPRSLLESTVSALESAIKAIDDILPLVNRVKWGAAIGCLGTYVADFFSGTKEAFACAQVSSGDKLALERALRGDQSQTVPSEFYNSYNQEEHANLQQCAAVKETARKTQLARQWMCDRIFCPAIPSAQRYANEQQQNPNSPSPCAEDALSFGSGHNTCLTDYQHEWRSACVAYDPVAESRKLDPTLDSEPAEGISRFLNVINGMSLCEFGDSEGEGTRGFERAGEPTVLEITEDGQTHYSLGTRTTVGEAPDNSVITEEGSIYSPIRIEIRNTSGDPIGGAADQTPRLGKYNDCVFVKPDQDNLNLEAFGRHEYDMLEVIGTNQSVPVVPVANPSEGFINTYGSDDFFVDRRGMVYKKEGDGSDAKLRMQPFYYIRRDGADASAHEFNPYDDAGNFKDPPRDCWNHDRIGEEAYQEFIKNPRDGFINSLQCACLPALEGYLIVFRNILNSIKNCFESVLVTGEFDTGICRAVLTQYLCDFVFDLIGCFTRTYSAGHEADSRGLAGALSALRDGGDRIKQSSEARYGTTETFNALFSERQLIHSICLAAFGFDWKPNIEGALSIQGGGFDINSTGIIAPATRRFMSYNPSSDGSATYVYHVGYFFIAGGDVNWQLELICSATNDCRPEDGYPDGRCDCAGLGTANLQQQPFGTQQSPYAVPHQGGDSAIGMTQILDGGMLQGGESVGGGTGNPYEQQMGVPGSGEVYLPLEHPVRYDKVRLSWTPRQTAQGGEGMGGSIIVPIRQVGGRSPAQCQFSLALGRYYCGMFSVEDGYVFFRDIAEYRNGGISNEAPGTEPFGQGQSIQYEVSYEYMAPQNDDEPIPRFLRFHITDEDGRIIPGSTQETEYQTVEMQRGSIRFPTSGKNAAQLLEVATEFVRAQSRSATSVVDYNAPADPADVHEASESTDGNGEPQYKYTIQRINNFVRSLGSGTTDYVTLSERSTERRLVFFVAKNESGTVTYYHAIKNPVPVAGGGHQTSVQLLIEAINNNELRPIELTDENTRRVRLSDISGAGLSGIIEFGACPSKDDITTYCAGYYELFPPENARSFSQRCEANQNNPLEWKAVFTFLDGERGTTGPPVRQSSAFGAGRETQETVNLRIACEGQTGEAAAFPDQPPLCPMNIRLPEGSDGCQCGEGNIFNVGSSNKFCISEDGVRRLSNRPVDCPVWEVGEASRPNPLGGGGICATPSYDENAQTCTNDQVAQEIPGVDPMRYACR